MRSGSRILDRTSLLWITVLAALAYGVALGGEFVFDDLHSVRDNPALRSLANIPAFFVDVDLFSSLDCRLYRPVLLCSFALDAAIGGMAAWTFKLTNLLLHVTAAATLASIAGCLGIDRGRALLGACLFAVHPMASEAINTVSGRSNLLMLVGLLLAVRCHLAAMRGQRWAGLATLGCGAISLGCKEPGMILPVLLLILEGLQWAAGPRRFDAAGRRQVRAAAWRVLPVVILVVGYIYARAHFLGATSFAVNPWQGAGVDSGHTRGMATQLAAMALLLPDTLRMLVLPYGMTMDPVIPYQASFSAPLVWGGIALLLILTGLGLRAPRRHPARFFGTCLAWGCAMPWVIKSLNHPYLEHRLYGVLAGLILVSLALLPRFEWQGLARRVKLPALLALLLLAAISARRSLEFRSSQQLWQLELSRNSGSKLAQAGLAVCYMEQRRFVAARPLLELLIRAYPERRDARMNLAEAELQLGAAGDPVNAAIHADYLIEHWGSNPFYRLLRSRTLAALGQRRDDASYFDAAVTEAMHCLEIAQPRALVYRTAASARRLQGRPAAALKILDRCLAAGLDHTSVRLDRSQLLLSLDQPAAARRELQLARQRDPFNPYLLAASRRLTGTAPGSEPPR